MPTTTRVFNFSAGPAVLPLPVLEEAQRDLVALPGVGMSVMEISHRSKTFEDLLHKAQADIRALAGVPPNYKVLLLQGGASLQFSMVPMNLLGAGADGRLHRHRLVGRQGDQGSQEGRQGERRRDRPRRDNYTRIPDAARAEADARRGVRPHDVATTRSKARSGRRCPTSATCRSSATPRRTCSAARSTSRGTALIYAGAQKNLGPSGVTLVIIREDLLARSARHAADDAELRGAGGERLALQHAEHVWHLHPRPGDEVAASRRAGSRRSRR